MRYGAPISKRVQFELSPSEFSSVVIENLPAYLETRALRAHKEYQKRIENNFVNEDPAAKHVEHVDVLYRRWRDAEDLAYLVAVAEDVNATTNLVMAGSKN